MIRPDQIPDEVLEAAARAITMALVLAVDDDTRALALTDDERKELSRAAIVAALDKWPGAMSHELVRFDWDGDFENDGLASVSIPSVILPLPTEKNDD